MLRGKRFVWLCNMSEWIKCSDELPPVFTRVLVYGKWYNSNIIVIGLRDNENNWKFLPALESVIYWQPLPQPPEN